MLKRVEDSVSNQPSMSTAEYSSSVIVMKSLFHPPDDGQSLHKSIGTGATEIDLVSLAGTRTVEVISSESKEI